MGVHVSPFLNLPPHPIPQGHPSAPALSTLSHASTWTGDPSHMWWYTCFNAILPNHPAFVGNKNIFQLQEGDFLGIPPSDESCVCVNRGRGGQDGRRIFSFLAAGSSCQSLVWFSSSQCVHTGHVGILFPGIAWFQAHVSSQNPVYNTVIRFLLPYAMW